MQRVLAVLAAVLALPAPAFAAPAGWSGAGGLALGRAEFTATVMSSGAVLVAGGETDYFRWTTTTEVYDPGRGTWAVGPGMTQQRAAHAATLLKNGKVLVTGGYAGQLLAGAELFDPAKNVWSPVPSMSQARAGHRSTLLPNGDVLISSGSAYEVYETATNSWRAPKAFRPDVTAHTATVLQDGRVLIAGGRTSQSTAAAWLYDPASGEFNPTGSMGTPRASHAATLLADGRVLVTGGFDSNGGGELSTVELYNPGTGMWTAGGTMTRARSSHSATPLSNGRVLLVDWGVTTELYDPGTGTAVDAGSLANARTLGAIAALRDGSVLLIGGYRAAAQGGSYSGNDVERFVLPTSVTVPASADTGAATVGDATGPRPVTITNSGDAPLFVDTVSVEGDFAVAADRCSGAAVAPGASCAIEVSFGPLAAGARTGTLRLRANTAQRDHAVALSGRGEPRPVAPPAFTPTPVPTVTPTATPTPRPPAKPVVEISFRSGYSPAGVSRARACKGRVSLELRRGKKVLQRRATRLDKRCRYAVTFSVKRTAAGKAKSLTVVARFHGNRHFGATTNRFTVKVPT
jgi:hypothetical protein